MRAGPDIAAIYRDLHVGAVEPDWQGGAFDHSFEYRPQLTPQSLCNDRLESGAPGERQIGPIIGDWLLPFVPAKGSACIISQYLDGLYAFLAGVPDAQRQAAIVQLELRSIEIDRYQLLAL
jgi:hypothetical protein